MTGHRLAVWGDPIAHSQSPQLHVAAYAALGVDWEYERRRVDAAAFATALGELDDSWRGLSLTMPLKEGAHAAADELDRHATLTGAVNTLLLGERVRGYNTDVGGIVDALSEEGLDGARNVRILGGGATASSALVAAAEIGAQRVEICARRPERAGPLQTLADRLELDAVITSLAAPGGAVDLTIATLPGGTALDESLASALVTRGGVLFDVAYSPWPSTLAGLWGTGTAVSGHGMLLHQAVRQVRVFLHGDPTAVLPDEESVVAAMRAAL